MAGASQASADPLTPNEQPTEPEPSLTLPDEGRLLRLLPDFRYPAL